MYGLRRRRMTHARLMRDELGEGIDHLRRAASHAAGGIGSSVGPGVTMARGYLNPEQVRDAAAATWETTVTAFAPLAAAARQSASQARTKQARKMKKFRKQARMSGRRWPMLVGLLAGGAAVGAAGAVVIRRRRRRQWEEYGVLGEESTMDTAKGALSSAMDKASFGVDRAMGAAAMGMDRAADRMSSALGAARERTETATETARRQADEALDTADGLLGGRAGMPPSKNSRG